MVPGCRTDFQSVSRYRRIKNPSYKACSTRPVDDPASGDVDSTRTSRIGHEARRRKFVAWPWNHYALGHRATQSSSCCATPTIFQINLLQGQSLLRKIIGGTRLRLCFSFPLEFSPSGRLFGLIGKLSGTILTPEPESPIQPRRLLLRVRTEATLRLPSQISLPSV